MGRLLLCFDMLLREVEHEETQSHLCLMSQAVVLMATPCALLLLLLLVQLAVALVLELEQALVLKLELDQALEQALVLVLVLHGKARDVFSSFSFCVAVWRATLS